MSLWQNIKTVARDGEFSDFTTIRKHRADYMIVICMVVLMLLGLVTIYAIGPQRANILNNAYGSNYSDIYFFVKQAISLVLSIGAFVVMAFLPYNLLTKNSSKWLIIAFGACLLLLVSSLLDLGIAQKSLGATRWFNLGIFGSLHPAEILKFTMLLFLAGFIGRKAKQGLINDFKATLLPVGIIAGLALIFVVIIQKDLGTGLSLASIILAMLFVGGLNLKNGLKIGALALLVGTILIVSAPHRIERVMTFLVVMILAQAMTAATR
jgi:cell division protein FtsW